MNAIRCPECKALNSNSAAECGQCKISFQNLPPTAYVSVPPAEFEKLAADSPRDISGARYDTPQDNETGRKIHLGYRVYCAFLLFVSVVIICTGVYVFTGLPGTLDTTPEGQTIGAVFYIISGCIATVLYSIALFSPRKPWSWVFGVVLLAIGIVTICFLPSLILLIFWSKPETRAYFGRKIAV